MPFCSGCPIPGSVLSNFGQSGPMGRPCPWQGVEQDIFKVQPKSFCDPVRPENFLRKAFCTSFRDVTGFVSISQSVSK